MTAIFQQLAPPTRLPNGMTYFTPKHPMGQARFPLPNDALIFCYQDDFFGFDVDFWSVGGVGTPTRAIATTGTFANGRLSIGTSGASGDTSIVQSQSNGVIAAAPRPLWFRVKFQFDDATNDAFRIGLIATTTPFTGTPAGIYLNKASGATSVSCTVSNGTTSTSVVVASSTVAATEYEAIIYWDGNTETGNSGNALGVTGNVLCWFFAAPLTTGQQQSTTAVPSGAAIIGTNLPASTVGLYTTFALQNGNAATHSMLVDFVQVGCGRNP